MTKLKLSVDHIQPWQTRLASGYGAASTFAQNVFGFWFFYVRDKQKRSQSRRKRMRDCVGQPAGPSNPGAVASNMCSRDLVAAQTNERHVCSGLPSNVGVKSGPDARSTTVFRRFPRRTPRRPATPLANRSPRTIPSQYHSCVSNERLSNYLCGDKNLESEARVS